MDPKLDTLQEAIRYFSDAPNCLRYFVARRWPNGVTCPTCGSKDVIFLEKQQRWQCRGKHPKRQFSAKAGTIFEDSPLGLDKWLAAMWLIANCKNGGSSYEIQRDIGVTQKTAWFMLHRIRKAFQTGSLLKMAGEVEVDETFIGGKARNMHKDKRAIKIQGTGGRDKTPVMGFLERGGHVRAMVVENRKKDLLQSVVRENVAAGAALYSDALASYDGLDGEFFHQVVDHAIEYARGHVHTNGLENFWSLLKRSLKGTYVSVEPYHLFRYLDEQAFRFNNRKITDSERFDMVADRVIGKRITCAQLTGKEGERSAQNC